MNRRELLGGIGALVASVSPAAAFIPPSLALTPELDCLRCLGAIFLQHDLELAVNVVRNKNLDKILPGELAPYDPDNKGADRWDRIWYYNNQIFLSGGYYDVGSPEGHPAFRFEAKIGKNGSMSSVIPYKMALVKLKHLGVLNQDPGKEHDL